VCPVPGLTEPDHCPGHVGARCAIKTFARGPCKEKTPDRRRKSGELRGLPGSLRAWVQDGGCPIHRANHIRSRLSQGPLG
jgi:hypothetical protein